MTPLELPLPTEAATVRLAELVAPLLEAGDLLVLTGGLGAGKTYFAGALCHALGLDADEPVTSPTFALVCEYELSLLVLHADLYRLEADSDVFELGLWERREAGALLVVEWGLSFVRELGGDPIELDFGLEPRCARFPRHGARSARFLSELEARIAAERARTSPLFT
jgi:tRNA threonylcarbamoyladenosine biosynthesis protein TsaE